MKVTAAPVKVTILNLAIQPKYIHILCLESLLQWNRIVVIDVNRSQLLQTQFMEVVKHCTEYWTIIWH